MAKVSEVELTAIQGFQKAFSQLTASIGELTIQQVIIEEEVNKAKIKAREFHVAQMEFLKKLEEKYGVGVINSEDGEFTPQT